MEDLGTVAMMIIMKNIMKNTAMMSTIEILLVKFDIT